MTTDELRKKFEAWLDENHLFDTANFIEPKADRERAKENNLVWLAYQAAHESLQGEIDVLRKGLLAVQCLIDESGGVYGLHLNGDNQDWDGLLEGGAYEDWLIDFSRARDQAIAKGE